MTDQQTRESIRSAEQHDVGLHSLFLIITVLFLIAAMIGLNVKQCDDSVREVATS